MKLITGLLVGTTILASGVAQGQYYPQASVSGYVLSYGPLGFMLQGPDGNYGIVVNGGTVSTDPWNSAVSTGVVNAQIGDYVTATGYPTGQWTMQAGQVIDQSVAAPVTYPSYGYPSYGGYYPSVFPNGTISGLGVGGTIFPAPQASPVRIISNMPGGVTRLFNMVQNGSGIW
jgi:hypothetical protein